GAVADDLVQGDHQTVCLHAVPFAALELGGAGGELRVGGFAGGFVKGAVAAGEEKILGAVFLVNFVFVGEIVADRGHAEIAGFDQGFYGFYYRKLELLTLVFCVPGSFLFKIAGVLGEVFHGGGDGFVGDGDKTLRTSLGAAGVAINFDESVVEVYGGVVLHPGRAEGQPFGVISGLVVADKMVD